LSSQPPSVPLLRRRGRTVSFDAGEGQRNTYAIRAIRTEPEAEGAAYEIDHGSGVEGIMTLKLKFELRHGRIIFSNQPSVIWRRQEPPG
jgi:hypothetical protein